mgnify:CR=1 FL=1
MKNEQLKIIVESLIDITEKAGKKTIELYNSGLKIIKKPDDSPVTNGDLEVDKMLKEKIKEFGKKSRKLVLENYDVRIISKKFVDLYYNILNKNLE